MKKLYVVHGRDSILSVVKANSKEEAFDVFAGHQIQDDYLREHISEFVVNASLLEEFYKDDKGSFFDNFTGEYPERIKKMNKRDLGMYVDSWIEKNAKQFWNDKPQFADKYLNELDNARKSSGRYWGEFSMEFWVDTIKRIIQKGNWYEDFNIVEIDLEDTNYQLIYQ